MKHVKIYWYKDKFIMEDLEMNNKKLQELNANVTKLITDVRNTLYDVEERLERCNGVRGVISLDDLEEMVDGLTAVLDDLMYLRLGG